MSRYPLKRLLGPLWSVVNLKSWRLDGQELVSVLLLFLVLEIAVGSIEQAHWIIPQPSLTVVLALAMLVTLLLSRSRLPAAVMASLVVALGAVVTIWQATNLLPTSELVSKTSQLVSALQYWWQTASLGKPSEGTIHFAVFLTIFTWFFGYVATWFVLQRRNAWVAVSLGTLALLVNLSNLTEKYHFFFFLYLLAAMLLIGQISLARHHYQFKKHSLTYPARSLLHLMAAVVGLSVITTALTWVTPGIEAKPVEVMANLPFRQNIEDFFTNFFSEVTVQQPYLSSDRQRSLLFGDPVDRSYTIHYVITSKRPFYWRTRMYDIYTARGWRSSPVTEYPPGQVIAGGGGEKWSNRSQLTHIVVPKLKSDILPSAGEFVSADIPAATQTLVPLTFGINLVSPFRDNSLPVDIASVARSLRATRAAARVFGPTEVRQQLPDDLTLTTIGERREAPSEANFESMPGGRRLNTIEVTRKLTGAGDVVAAITPQLLNPDQRFTVISSITSATPAELSQAGENYPRRITDYYLQLPPGLPERIKQLSKTITSEARTPYDKALAIKQYLSQIPYYLWVESPPGGVDGVEHFLFTQQEGDCFYFASAMAVMLRSVGIPSRLVVGYLPGEWDDTAGTATVRAKDYHAWTDVYFPGYGWIEFDPTPAPNSTEASFIGDLEIAPGGEEDLATSDEGLTLPEWLGLTTSLPVIGTFLAILLVLALALSLYRWQQRFSGLDYVSTVYAKMCFFASLVRLGPRLQQTPLEYCTKLASAFPGQAHAISHIGQSYVESRFGGRKLSAGWQKARLQQSWRKVYRSLLKRLFLWR